MRLHSFAPWPPPTLQPVRKQEKTRKSKAVDASVKTSASRVNGVQARQKRTEDEDDSPGDRLDIIV
jgi:hypothetical protein